MVDCGCSPQCDRLRIEVLNIVHSSWWGIPPILCWGAAGFTPCSHPVAWPHAPRWQDQTLLAIATAARPLVDPCRACGIAAVHIQTWDAQGHMNISFQRCIPKELQSSMYKKIPCMVHGSVRLFQKDPQSCAVILTVPTVA